MGAGDTSAIVQGPCSTKERHTAAATTGEALEEAAMEDLHGEVEVVAWEAWEGGLPLASV